MVHIIQVHTYLSFFLTAQLSFMELSSLSSAQTNTKIPQMNIVKIGTTLKLQEKPDDRFQKKLQGKTLIWSSHHKISSSIVTNTNEETNIERVLNL